MTPEQFWQNKNGGKPSEIALSHGEYSSPVYVVRLITEYHQQESSKDKERIAELENEVERLRGFLASLKINYYLADQQKVDEFLNPQK